MAKARSLYVCDSCGNETLKWQGQCPSCGAWNTLSAISVSAKTPSRAAWVGTGGGSRPLKEGAEADVPRFSTGIAELDRVLGSGLVPGSVTLLGGDPGIGK